MLCIQTFPVLSSFFFLFPSFDATVKTTRLRDFRRFVTVRRVDRDSKERSKIKESGWSIDDFSFSRQLIGKKSRYFRV